MTSIQEVKHKQVYTTGKRMGIIQVEAKERIEKRNITKGVKMERNREEIRKRLEEMLKGNEEIVVDDWAKDPDDYKVLEGKWVINEVELDEFAKKTRSANKQGEYTEKTIYLIESFGYKVEAKLTNEVNSTYEVFITRRY